MFATQKRKKLNMATLYHELAQSPELSGEMRHFEALRRGECPLPPTMNSSLGKIHFDFVPHNTEYKKVKIVDC